jgi:hypothetical protein
VHQVRISINLMELLFEHVGSDVGLTLAVHTLESNGLVVNAVVHQCVEYDLLSCTSAITTTTADCIPVLL